MLARLSCRVAHWAGHPAAVIVAALAIAASYHWLGLEATNLAISVVSLLLLFLLQGSQNRDGAAIQLKLDGLIEGTDARNELVGADHLTEQELRQMRGEA